MSMKIEVSTDQTWNNKCITFVEEPSAMGDQVKVCIHDQGDDPHTGYTAKVYRDDIIRLAKMLATPYVNEADQ